MEYIYTEEFSIRNSDFSYKDEIKPQSILEIFEEIAGRHADKLNIGYNYCKNHNLAWVCVRTKVKILSNLINGENGLVSTYPIKCGRIDFDRNYIISSLDNTKKILATTKWILIDYNTRRIQRSNVIDYPSDIDGTNLLDVSSKIVGKTDNLNNRIDIDMKLNDLDHNGHVNNARYVEYVFNTFDNVSSIDSFEVEYIKELKYQEKAYILFDDLKQTYKIYNQNDELSFVMNITWR